METAVTGRSVLSHSDSRGGQWLAALCSAAEAEKCRRLSTGARGQPRPEAATRPGCSQLREGSGAARSDDDSDGRPLSNVWSRRTWKGGERDGDSATARPEDDSDEGKREDDSTAARPEGDSTVVEAHDAGRLNGASQAAARGAEFGGSSARRRLDGCGDDGFHSRGVSGRSRRRGPSPSPGHIRVLKLRR